MEVAHVVVHDGSVLFFFGFLEDNGHRFDDIVFHSLGVVDGTLYLLDRTTSFANTSLELLFEFLDDSPLELINYFVELTEINFDFSLFFLIYLRDLVNI